MLLHLGDVLPGAENFAVPRYDHTTHLRIFFGVSQCILQSRRHFKVEGIGAFRTIKAQGEHTRFECREKRSHVVLKIKSDSHHVDDCH